MSKKTLQTATDEDDPYSKLLHEDDNKLKTPEKESSRARKIRLLKGKSKEMYANFSNGFMIGSLVGGSFGTIIGLYTAVVNRSLLLLPISAIISSASFGFFLGVGSMIRSDEFDLEKMKLDLRLHEIKHNGDYQIHRDQLWVMRNMMINGNI